MIQSNRRDFLKGATAGAVGLSLAPAFLSARPASDNLRVAIAGLNGRGNAHISEFQGLEGVDIVALIDPDSKIRDKRVQEFTNKYKPSAANKVTGYADVRKVLERDDIDAIVIATPNHWHSLMTVWACQAGKHVYVEKPVSHSIWEGRKMVEAARKYDRIVQAGTQQRSCPAVQELARDIKAGRWGKVKWIHCSKLGARASIGKVTEPQPVPENIDYNLWAGPAPMTPVMRKQFHYDWHWQWNWGDGEMGNWGVHYIDDFRHFMGWNSVPTKVIAAGNRFAWDDNGETPNMHFALFDYEGIPVVVDIRNLPDPKRRGGSSGAVYLKSRGGNYVECENATIRIARGGGMAYDDQGKSLYQYKGTGGSGHALNFINAVRAKDRTMLAADIEVGHLSTAICHQANLAFRAGAEATPEQVRESMSAHPDAVNTLNDMLEQIDGNGVDLKKTPFMLGPQLTFDTKVERFVGRGSRKANQYIKRTYRDGFVIPDEV